MKNKIITLVCIFAIILTTAIVAFANQANPTYENSNSTASNGSKLINQHVYNMADAELPDGYTEPLYPDGGIYRKVKVENLSQQYDVLVKTVFIFEAGNISDLEAFKKVFDISLSSDNGNWTLNNEWKFIQHDGKNYVMTSATYERPLNKDTADNVNSWTDTLFVKVEMLDTVKNEMIYQFADSYKMLVTSYAVQADGWTLNNSAVEINEPDVVTGILDQVFDILADGYAPEWDELTPSQNY